MDHPPLQMNPPHSSCLVYVKIMIFIPVVVTGLMAQEKGQERGGGACNCRPLRPRARECVAEN